MSRSSSFRRGFTLIELIVSIAIIGVILTVVLGNQSMYTESAALSNLADDMGLRVTEAQAYGIAVKERSPGSADFSAAYGVSASLLDDGSDAQYLVFADRNGDGVYNGTVNCETGGANECLEKVSLTRGNVLEEICILNQAENDNCTAPKRADITFARPDPAARISLFNSSGTTFAPASMNGVKFVFRSPGGLSRTVSVYLNGQVSVQ